MEGCRMRRAMSLLLVVAFAAGSGQSGRIASAQGPPALGSLAPDLVDFNGDGFADLAVGVPDQSVSGVVIAGAVQVLYGSGTRVQATQPNDQVFTQDSPGVLETA